MISVSCGGSNPSYQEDEEDEAVQTETQESADDDAILTEKLIGTPFEGLTTGDEFGWCFFRQNQYFTQTVDAFPIPVFLAFFTEFEESKVIDGIELANVGIGFEALEVVDTWQDDARVIYKVNDVDDESIDFNDDDAYRLQPSFLSAAGIANATKYRFNGKQYAETIVPDWSIELREGSVYKFIVAHELGHAFGLYHGLIDYENDTLSLDALEDNSVMDSLASWSPIYTDYNSMMQMQGAIFQSHLGEISEDIVSECD